ncbi:MAG: hypothetical protein DRJ10_16580 [Bacteroidetes bacterium]|nr:MAG: hypothetical protein DRJ10_16580 [Bacteroidota bacterium]
MNELYSLLFSLDNTKKEQNFVMDINEITNLQSEKNQKVKIYLDQAIISPRKVIVDELFDLIRTNKF